MERLFWWLIAGKRGGKNRARIIKKLADRPYNANQLADQLHLDYKTVMHHIRILEKNDIIHPSQNSYGRLYFLTYKMKKNLQIFNKIYKNLDIE